MRNQIVQFTLMLAMLFGAFSVSAQEFTAARKIGKAGCDRGFYDVGTGDCYECPAGYKRSVASVTSKNACERPATMKYAKAINKGRAGGIFGTDCPAGSFYDPNGNCYTCPNGYKRTVYPVTGGKACEQRQPAGYQYATKVGDGDCPNGSFFDPIQGGTCWTCPPGYKRSIYRVDGQSGCVKN